MNVSVTNRSTYISYRNKNVTGILEFLFLAYLIYSLISVPLGINVTYLAGAWLSSIAFVSLFNVDWKTSARIPMILIVAISVSYLGIEYLVYKASLSLDYVWPFVMWLPLAAVIFILSGRPGFIKRLVIVMFLIGLFLHSFIVTHIDIVSRQSLDSGSGIDNSNDYAAWMGFCALVFWLWSWKASNIFQRFLLWGLFAVSAYFLMGTVSRGALLSLAAGILLGLRSIPRRNWLLIAIILGFFYFALQVYSSSSITDFQARLYEESGRLSGWPMAVVSFESSPLLGYGVAAVANKNAGIDITPHNGVLFLGLASGFLPTLLYIIVYGLAIFRGYKNKPSSVERIDVWPLIIFVFLETMQSNLYFVAVWATVALFYCFQEDLVAKRTQLNPAIRKIV